MDENSDDFSDELDEFEESFDDHKQKENISNNGKKPINYTNKPYDEAFEISQDLSMAESYDGREKNDRQLKNDKYDEAVDVSQSLDQPAAQYQMAAAASKPKVLTTATNNSYKNTDRNDSKFNNNNITGNSNSDNDDSGHYDDDDGKGLVKNQELSKSQTIINRPFDEALEFSPSSSEGDSVDTHDDNDDVGSSNKNIKGGGGRQQQQQQQKQTVSSQQQQYQLQQQQAALAQQQKQAMSSIPQISAAQKNAAANLNTQVDSPPSKKGTSQSKGGKDESSDDDDGDQDESYDNIEGAYNAKDYLQLNVSVEVRDLFQYIERYKPHEVQLDTPLKCFIPEYIPAIGELDAFIKIPRPDNKEDGLGLRYLDEPCSNQSDPTVLELQLRAKTKKLQYGDIAVRSIEYAEKYPNKIEKWIQDIKDLHRSKPPPQVIYKKSMPDIEQLMEIWSEEFELLLSSTTLPSPDLDLNLFEYTKVLCSILDIPIYDNIIESLHIMLSLFIDFRNNPHFQARLYGNNNNGADNNGGNSDRINQADGKNINIGGGMISSYDNNYGHADVLEIAQDEYK